MKIIDIKAGPYRFKGRLEEAQAPDTCKRFLELLPYTNRVIHSRWSGEAVWIPLGEFDMGLDFENHTCHPSRGDILLYPGGFSETEFLFVYGSSSFASKMGALAGNHFITLTQGHENLEAFGKLVLWEGAQEIEFSLATD
ncbi:MAG: DUF3830 family protein [Amphritea sp.]